MAPVHGAEFFFHPTRENTSVMHCILLPSLLHVNRDLHRDSRREWRLESSSVDWVGFAFRIRVGSISLARKSDFIVVSLQVDSNRLGRLIDGDLAESKHCKPSSARFCFSYVLRHSSCITKTHPSWSNHKTKL